MPPRRLARRLPSMDGWYNLLQPPASLLRAAWVQVVLHFHKWSNSQAAGRPLLVPGLTEGLIGMSVLQTLLYYLDPRHLIAAFGPFAYLGLFAVIFAESGLFFGFFLPGDSLLLTAGLVAYEGSLSILALVPLLFVAAVLGDNVGYWFGRKAGPPLFSRDESLLFKRKNLLAAKAFYERHGSITIVLARFMPFIRTFAPIVAGAVEMEYRRFMVFNLLGGFLWAAGVTLAGYFLGSLFPPDMLERYFLAIVVAVILISVLPTALHLWKENRHALLARLRQRRVRVEDGEPEI
jgi:membrane-associated protein